MPAGKQDLTVRLASLKVLLVDDQVHMRKVLRAILAGIGIRKVEEASDGAAGLAVAAGFAPDIILVDWDMPLIDGLQFVRMVRTPGQFPYPTVPIIMLTGHGDRWRVVEAARHGVHEFLLKPVSTQSLKDRICMVLTRPRPMIRLQDSYVPVPRRVVVEGQENSGDDPEAVPVDRVMLPT